MYGYIYLTTNLTTGKKYLGQHKAKSFDNKYLGSGSLLLKELQEFGTENFSCSILESLNDVPTICNSKEELNASERYYIKLFNCVDSNEYYNLHPGGYHCTSFNELEPEIREAKRVAHSKDTSCRVWLTNGSDNKYPHLNSQTYNELIAKGYTQGRTIDTSNIGKYKRTEEHKRSLVEAQNRSDVKQKRIENIKKTWQNKSEEDMNEFKKNCLYAWNKHSDEEKHLINKKKGRSRFGKSNPVYGRHYIWLTNDSLQIEMRLYEEDMDKLSEYLALGYRRGRCAKHLFGTGGV